MLTIHYMQLKSDILSWLSGFFDAEATVSINPRAYFIQVSNKDLNLLNNIKFLLK